MKKKECLFIGHFSENIGDGQIVRTNSIKEQLIKKLGEDNLTTINIKNWKNNPISLLFTTTIAIIKHKKIILISSTRGIKIISKLISLFKKKKTFLIVIGGSLPKHLKKQKRLKRRLKRIEGLFVQTEMLTTNLRQIGFKNVHILSNFKNIDYLEREDLFFWNGDEEVIRVCTLSRVTKSKGISDAIEAVLLLNKKTENKKVILDIYGSIDPNYKEEFLKMVDNDFVQYKGLIPYDKTHLVLKDYYVLLFPTFWEGEGFAGTLLDSFYAGIPVIASNWNFNAEIIQHMENGIIVNIKSPREIKEAIFYLMHHHKKRNEMALNNYKKSLNYRPDKVMEDFYNKLFA